MFGRRNNLAKGIKIATETGLQNSLDKRCEYKKLFTIHIIGWFVIFLNYFFKNKLQLIDLKKFWLCACLLAGLSINQNTY